MINHQNKKQGKENEVKTEEEQNNLFSSNQNKFNTTNLTNPRAEPEIRKQ